MDMAVEDGAHRPATAPPFGGVCGMHRPHPTLGLRDDAAGQAPVAR